MFSINRGIYRFLCWSHVLITTSMVPRKFWYTFCFFLAGPGPLHEIAVSAHHGGRRCFFFRPSLEEVYLIQQNGRATRWVMKNPWPWCTCSRKLNGW